MSQSVTRLSQEFSNLPPSRLGSGLSHGRLMRCIDGRWLIEWMQRLQAPNQCRSLRRAQVLAVRRHVAAALQHLPNQLVLRETRCDKIQGRATKSPDPANRMAVAALLRLKDDRALTFERACIVGVADRDRRPSTPRAHLRTPRRKCPEMREYTPRDG